MYHTFIDGQSQGHQGKSHSHRVKKPPSYEDGFQTGEKRTVGKRG
jgi:hypothetical protein